MGVAKFSVSFDPDLGDAIRHAAEDEDQTVSAWLADAARQRIKNLLLGQVLDELIAEMGWTEEQLRGGRCRGPGQLVLGRTVTDAGRSRAESLMALVLDAGALIAYERGDDRVVGLPPRRPSTTNVPVRTSAAVVAQVWRDGARQARLARVLAAVHEEPLDPDRARHVGLLLGANGTSDVVDAAVVDVAEDGDEILTADPEDIAALARSAGLRVTGHADLTRRAVPVAV